MLKIWVTHCGIYTHSHQHTDSYKMYIYASKYVEISIIILQWSHGQTLAVGRHQKAPGWDWKRLLVASERWMTDTISLL